MNVYSPSVQCEERRAMIMIHLATCDACGREDMLCEVEVWADQDGLLQSPICVDTENCMAHWS